MALKEPDKFIIYLLKEDRDGTLRSHTHPIGRAVLTKEEADRWVKGKAESWHFREYEEIEINLHDLIREIGYITGDRLQ